MQLWVIQQSTVAVEAAQFGLMGFPQQLKMCQSTINNLRAEILRLKAETDRLNSLIDASPNSLAVALRNAQTHTPGRSPLEFKALEDNVAQLLKDVELLTLPKGSLTTKISGAMVPSHNSGPRS
jgi:hypothetical protein